MYVWADVLWAICSHQLANMLTVSISTCCCLTGVVVFICYLAKQLWPMTSFIFVMNQSIGRIVTWPDLSWPWGNKRKSHKIPAAGRSVRILLRGHDRLHRLQGNPLNVTPKQKCQPAGDACESTATWTLKLVIYIHAVMCWCCDVCVSFVGRPSSWLAQKIRMCNKTHNAMGWQPSIDLF